ncbi:MAG: LacI family transcription regulator, partial [Pseudonocardiales bacterium]|nr:LacI family transcription regulator [Pseudonocardiales bacterium]
MATPDRKRPFVERRGDTLRVRWSGPDGKLRSASRNDKGEPFADKAAAELYGYEQIGKIERGEWADPADVDLTVGEWIPDWWSRNDMDDLSWSTRSTYRWAIEGLIWPQWGNRKMASLTHCEGELATWRRELRGDYAEKSVNLVYALFSTMLADAHIADLLKRDPTLQARTQRRRGRRVRTRGAGSTGEKPWTTPMQALLIAERVAALTGRADDFVLVITKAYTGMRWSELVGLEQRYVRDTVLRVEWQLQRQDRQWVRIPPKDESRRDVDLPPFLSALLTGQMASHDGRCTCAGHKDRRYVWIAKDGSHTYRTVFDASGFKPATEGWRPPNHALPRRPVGVRFDVWPGEPLTEATIGRADACWAPIVPGATPHSLRHGHKTWMIDARVEEVLQHERLGH